MLWETLHFEFPSFVFRGFRFSRFDIIRLPTFYVSMFEVRLQRYDFWLSKLYLAFEIRFFNFRRSMFHFRFSRFSFCLFDCRCLGFPSDIIVAGVANHEIECRPMDRMGQSISVCRWFVLWFVLLLRMRLSTNANSHEHVRDCHPTVEQFVASSELVSL